MTEYHTVRGKSVTWRGAGVTVNDDGSAQLSVHTYILDDIAEADVVALYQVLGDVVEWGDSGLTEGAVDRKVVAGEAQDDHQP